ncbi:unnamed protein product, partial [Medioppia subpectinata]
MDDRSAIYPINSWDRFGDDLCQHLLSYLPLDDRFRYEVVSKQWQRVVYETQRELILDHDFGYRLNYSSLESLLKKCRNIT